MKNIQKATQVYFASATLTVAAGVLLVFCIPYRSLITLLPLLFLAACIFIGLGVWKTILLKAARLITENGLFQISPVMLTGADRSPASDPETEIVVSCFGVLINSRVVRFNRRENRLWRVEIGRDSLKLFYGAQNDQKQMTLIHEPIDTDTARRLAERFRIETGAEIIFPDSFLV